MQSPALYDRTPDPPHTSTPLSLLLAQCVALLANTSQFLVQVRQARNRFRSESCKAGGTGIAFGTWPGFDRPGVPYRRRYGAKASPPRRRASSSHRFRTPEFFNGNSPGLLQNRQVNRFFGLFVQVTQKGLSNQAEIEAIQNPQTHPQHLEAELVSA